MKGEHGDTMTSDQDRGGGGLADSRAPQERSQGAAMTDVILGAKKRSDIGHLGLLPMMKEKASHTSCHVDCL